MLKSVRAAVVGAALLAPALLAGPAAALGFYSGTVSGYFTNPVTSGDVIDTDGNLLFVDGASAAYSGFGTSTITWGRSDTFHPGYSSLNFTGDSFVNQRACCGDEGAGPQFFKIGSMTYFNGTSDNGTLIYGATLHVDVSDASVLGPGGSHLPADITGFDLDMAFLATLNTGLGAARDSDFLVFPGLDATFNVYENGTATIDFYTALFGDPQMTFETFDNLVGGGFIGAGVSDPDPIGGGVPEPAVWAMLLLGFGGVGAALRQRRRPWFAFG